MSLLRLHGTSGVLAGWAAAWQLGVRGDAIIVLILASTATTVWVQVREMRRRRHG